jgi:hypothetical protein
LGKRSGKYTEQQHQETERRRELAHQERLLLQKQRMEARRKILEAEDEEKARKIAEQKEEKKQLTFQWWRGTLRKSCGESRWKKMRGGKGKSKELKEKSRFWRKG